MGLIVNTPALSIGAGALYPRSAIDLDEYRLLDRFGEEFLLAQEVPELDAVLLPRRFACFGPDTQDFQTEGKRCGFRSVFKPWDEEQARVVDESTALLKSGASFQLRAPTGFGKTFCMTEVIARIGRKTLVIVPKEDLKNEWVHAGIELLGLSPARIGLIQGDEIRVEGCPIVIAMIQSVCKLGRYPASVFQDFGLAIWDESHLASAAKFQRSAYVIPAKLRVGVSATAGKRKDGRDVVFDSHVGPVLVQTEVSYVTPNVLRVTSPWRLPRDRWGKPVRHEPTRDAHVIRMIANSEPRNRLIARFVARSLERGRQVIVFSGLRNHLDRLYDYIRAAKVEASDIAYYVGGMTESQREKAKLCRVLLATYKMAEYGTNIPSLDTAVLATPRADVEQIVGRIRRKLDSKKQPLVLDIVDETSGLYSRYWGARQRWYRQIGSQILNH